MIHTTLVEKTRRPLNVLCFWGYNRGEYASSYYIKCWENTKEYSGVRWRRSLRQNGGQGYGRENKIDGEKEGYKLPEPSYRAGPRLKDVVG